MAAPSPRFSPATTSAPTRYEATQLELPLEVSASPGFRVQRVGEHVVLTPQPVKLWGSVGDAARMLRRSERWVRVLCEEGVIRARKLPGASRWDVDLLALQEWAEGGL